ncbi:MAG: VOC family protein [Xanthomonadales bacterium]|nr:VOC family protein [Xanthomonadales bacterium]
MQRSPLTPSLYTDDLAGTIAFYTEVLGFEQTGRWDEDEVPIWAELTLRNETDAARIWFFTGQIQDRPGPALSGVIYLFVDDVDAEAARIGGRATVSWGPEDQPYGLREFAVEDPNGYLVCLARDID